MNDLSVNEIAAMLTRHAAEAAGYSIAPTHTEEARPIADASWMQDTYHDIRDRLKRLIIEKSQEIY